MLQCDLLELVGRARTPSSISSLRLNPGRGDGCFAPQIPLICTPHPPPPSPHTLHQAHRRHLTGSAERLPEAAQLRLQSQSQQSGSFSPSASPCPPLPLSLLTPRRTDVIPQALLGDYQKLLSSAPSRRLNPSKVAECKFLNNRLVDTVSFMENIALKDSIEKVEG